MVVTRFAPSPTGLTHIGGIRTALYDYALAKKNNGKFILRIEDTDNNRLVPGAEQDIVDMLKVYGLDFDEKYKQSERLEIYKEYAEKLIDKGDAYYCFLSIEEIDAMRKKAQEEKRTFIFRSPYRDTPINESRERIAKGDKYVIRQKLPDNYVVVFDDPVQGTMSFNTNDIDETVLLKSDGFPTYHLAVIVDDHLMEITHAIRGVEWLPSVPKHVLLYKSFGFTMPVIIHLPVILDPDGGKLSKRKGAVSAKGFIQEGYLPEAVLNFLMLLGWSSPLKYEHGEKEREIFGLDDFTSMFDLKDINKASPVFNRDKLLWFNQKYISALSPDELSNRYLNWLKQFGDDEVLSKAIIERGPDYIQPILLLERSRIHLLKDLNELLYPFYFHNGKFDLLNSKQTKDLKIDDIKGFLKYFIGILEEKDISKMSHEQWEGYVRDYAQEKGLKAGSLFMGLRLSVVETPFSPPLFEVLGILGNNEIIKRISKYL